MSPTTREICKGLAGGMGFLLSLGFFGMPFWLAIGIGAGLYLSVHLMLPPAANPPAPSPTLGVSTEERDQFLAACRKNTTELTRLAARIPEPVFRQRVRDLAGIAEHLLDYFSQHPSSILVAFSVPGNLERLAAMLQQYVALCQVPSAGKTAREAMRRVEEIVNAAHSSFTAMYQQLLEEDVAALDNSARTLAILLDLDSQSASPDSAPLSEPPLINRRVVSPPRPTEKGTQL